MQFSEYHNDEEFIEINLDDNMLNNKDKVN